MTIELRAFTPEANRSELKRFVDFPFQLYKDDPVWVPTLRLQTLDDLDTKKNPFYRHAAIQCWNAYRDGQQVGRIAAIHDERHIQVHEESVGFFGFFECVNDPAVAKLLFHAVESWLRGRGLKHVRGPANPSLNHSCGIQIDHFEDSPYVMMAYNPKYYLDLLGGQGYGKVKDLLCYETYSDRPFPPVMVKLAERVNRKNRITYRGLNMKRFAEEVKMIREIYNSAWEKNWGFVPMDDAEFDHLAKSMKDVIWPNFCLIAEIDGKPIGFSVTLPDVNQAVRHVRNGKLLPFGIFKLLWGLRPKKGWVDRARVITLGVKEEYRATGVANILFYETYRRAPDLGIKKGEISWVLEDNKNMRNAAEMMGGKEPTKTYRLYQKAL